MAAAEQRDLALAELQAAEGPAEKLTAAYEEVWDVVFFLLFIYLFIIIFFFFFLLDFRDVSARPMPSSSLWAVWILRRRQVECFMASASPTRPLRLGHMKALPIEDFKKPCSELSGGWQMRVATPVHL